MSMGFDKNGNATLSLVLLGTFALLILVVLIPAFAESSVNVGYDLDQKYTDTDCCGGAKVEVQGGVWGACTYQPAVTGVRECVKLYCMRAGAPGTVTVKIRAVDANHKPTGAAICEGTFDGDKVSSTVPEWRRCVFTTTGSLTADTEYALQASLVGSEGNDLYWYIGDGLDYARVGARCSTADAGVNWTVESDEFMLFKEYTASEAQSMTIVFARMGEWALVAGGVVVVVLMVFRKMKGRS